MFRCGQGDLPGPEVDIVRSKTFVSVVSLVGLGVIGTAQGASGTGLPPNQIPPPKVYTPWGPGEVPPEADGLCGSAPTLALCNSKAYQACEPTKHPVCDPILQAAAAAQAAAGTPSCHMDASHDHCVPDVTEKHESLYSLDYGTDWPSQESFSAAWVHNSKAWGNPWTPQNYRRDYAKASTKIDSCEAYVYAKYYDYERFLDSSYACDGNDQCVVDVALTGPMKAPRLAGRVLNDVNDKPIVPHDIASESHDAEFMLDGGYDNIPKNSFYAAAAFMPPAIFDALKAAWANDPAMVAKLETLRLQLEKGYHYYNYGDAEGLAVEYHPTAWAWHSTMNNRTKPKAYAPAQIIEFEDRRDRVERAIWNLGSLYACTGLSLPCLTLPLEVARVTPGMAESRPADPFGMGSILTHNELFSTALQGALESMFLPGQVAAGGFGVNLANLGSPLAGHAVHAKKAVPQPTTTAPAGTIVSRPAVTTLRPTWTGFPPEYWTKIDFTDQDSMQMTSTMIQKAWAATPPPVVSPRRGASYPRLDCAALDGRYETASAASCELANVVLDEWARSLAGNESCLDMNGYGCDWSPASFRKSVVGSPRMQSSRQLDYKECLKYTHNNFATVANAPVVQVPLVDQGDWNLVHTWITTREAAVKDFKRKVPSVDDPAAMGISATDSVYGDRSADTQQWGNDVFGAGYSYDIGWDAAVLARAGTGNAISRMQLDFNGDFEAHASAFGSNITLLETHLGARVNDDDSNEVEARHYLYIIGVGTFDGLNVKNYQHVTDIAQSFELADPHDKFKNNVFDAGFWCGPVYVHVGLDVEFFYDAPLRGAVSLPAKNGTQKVAIGPNSLVSAELTFQPKAGVNADIYAYGGWGPLAEVGFEAKLNLITLGLPMRSSVGVTATKDTHGYDQLNFAVEEGMDVTVDTLSGEVDVCGKIIGIGGCKKLISWKGLHMQFPLFKPISESIELGTL